MEDFCKNTCETCNGNDDRIHAAAESSFVLGVMSCVQWCRVRTYKDTDENCWKPVSWFKKIMELEQQVADLNTEHKRLLGIVTDFITLIQGRHDANDTIAKVVVFERRLVEGGFVNAKKEDG